MKTYQEALDRQGKRLLEGRYTLIMQESDSLEYYLIPVNKEIYEREKERSDGQERPKLRLVVSK